MVSHAWRNASLALLAAGLAAAPAQAQLEDNLSSLTGDQTTGYLGPLAAGLSGTMNSGLFRSGNVPAAGVNITVDLKASYISFSDDDRIYATPEIPGYASVDAPTVIGDPQSVSVNHDTQGSAAQFTYPGGFDLKNFGIAVPQITVGNVVGTRAMFRYIPSISLGDDEIGSLELIGFGAQHSVSRYLPGLPVDVAVGLMWTNFKVGDGIVDATALAYNVTGSRRFGRAITVEPYVGLGLDSFDMSAEYTSGSEEIKIEFDRNNDFHFTLGTGVNFPGVKLHAELDVAAVTGFAGGLSFGI